MALSYKEIKNDYVIKHTPITHGKIDAVVLYVNGNEPVWQLSYMSVIGTTIDTKRFRSWDNLQILIAGIRKYMSWINNIYVVVSNIEQLNDFDLKPYDVDIITHKEFIPETYLPTFNCNTIETNLYRIQGILENFIYFNDDMFPIAPLTISDFYTGNLANIYMNRLTYTKSDDIGDGKQMFADICYNSTMLANTITHSNFPNNQFIRPLHCCLQHKKSIWEMIWNKEHDFMEHSMTKIRQTDNINQYIMHDYLYMKGLYANKKLPYTYTAFNSDAIENSVSKICGIINNKASDIICINDAGLDKINSETFIIIRDTINKSLSDNIFNKN